jgi:hypothetical protein
MVIKDQGIGIPEEEFLRFLTLSSELQIPNFLKDTALVYHSPKTLSKCIMDK